MALSQRAALAKDRRNATAELRSPLTHRTFAVIAGILHDTRSSDLPAEREASRRFISACGGH